MSADAVPKAPEKKSALAFFADIGAAGQAVVPGAYAWAVTVAPAAFTHGSNGGVQAAAVLAIVSLLSTLVRKESTGAIATWVFVLASTVVWVATPAQLAPAHLHPARGIAGMLGWGAFAFAAAAPSLGPPSKDSPETHGGLKPRIALARGDAIYLAIAVVLAGALQFVGWGILVPERAVFVRLLTVASGLSIIGVATVLATSRHNLGSNPKPSFARALRKSAFMVVVVVLLVAFGLAYAFAGS